MGDSERRWNEDKDRNGWAAPPPARRVWRLPLVRHIRCLFKTRQVNAHNKLWSSTGSVITGYDHWVLYAVWRGWV